MSVEHLIYGVVSQLCERVFPDVAPEGTATPYVVYQGAGGRTARYVDGLPADQRNTLMQVRVWAQTRLEAMELARAIEDALCVSVELTAAPQGEPVSVHEQDTDLYGSIQRFSIWATR